jgi:ferredoxin-NADP reductase/MOSC domain-containing protein YiiM/ferredoxin
MNKVVSVNVGLPKEVDWNGRRIRTAIWKQPVAGRIRARATNLDGDGQADLAGHGGVHRAVMVYQLDSYRYWVDQFGQLEPGGFGENLTIDGLPDSDVWVGDRLRIGDALFEVSQPRVTCYRLGVRLKHPQAAALLVAHHRPGFYLRVLEEGTVAAGDDIQVVSRDSDGMSVADVSALLYLGEHPRAKLEQILRVRALSPGWQASFRAILDGHSGLSSAQAAAWNGFRRLTVVSTQRESDDVESLVLSGADLPSFLPGQHIVVRVQAGSRSYSLAGAPASGTFRIGVKREPHGIVSAFVQEHLKVGDVVDVSAPRGDFVLAEGDGPIVLISAGIGITPMLAMLYATAQSPRPVWWVYGARDSTHHPFAAETRRLLGQMAHATSCIVYSRPLPGDRYDVEGHITTAVIEKLGAPQTADFYLCGPTAFNESLRDALIGWGVEASRIHIELFGPGQSLTPAVLDTSQRRPHAPEGQPGDGPSVSFAKSALTVPWASRFHSLLELAEACDVPVRWSCRTGVCHTCECGLIEGNVAYSPEPLDPAAQGNALICCSAPLGDIQLDL